MSFIVSTAVQHKNKCWEHGERLVDIVSHKVVAKCKHCPSQIKCSDRSPANFVNHLKRKHGIDCKVPDASGSSQTAQTTSSGHKKRGRDHDGNESAINLDSDDEKESQPPVKKLKQITDYYRPVGQDTLEKCVSCMAIDNVSINFIAKNEFVRSSFRLKGLKLPKSPAHVMDLMHKDAEDKRKVTIKILEEIVDEGGRLGMIIDEWLSLRQRRYFNLTLTHETLAFNLGMVRIKGSFTSENGLAAIHAHLSRFSLILKNHIIATTNDGTSVMKNGRISGLVTQICLNHGIHLSVEDSGLFKKRKNASLVDESATDELNYDDDDDDEDFENIGNGEVVFADDQSIEYHASLKKAHHIVKFIRDSSLRNDYFMNLSGRELKFDVKTRWNSSGDMLEALIESKTAVIATLDQFNARDRLEGLDWDELAVMKKVLKPLKVTVLALGRDDSDLEKAEKAVKFMLDELHNIAIETQHEFAWTVYNNTKNRMEEREYTEILKLLKCLRDPNLCPQWDTLELARSLMKKLYPLPNVNLDDSESDEETSENGIGEKTLADELNAIKDEFLLFKANGKRTANLEKLRNALLSIKPTSTAVERVFSASSDFVTKIHSRLSDESIDDLVFLKFFYKSLTSRWNKTQN